MSDRFTGLNAVVVPGTLKDSLVILGLLLGQETELEPAERIGAATVNPVEQEVASPVDPAEPGCREGGAIQ